MRPPICDPRILRGGVNQTAVRVATAINDTAKVNYVVVKGYQSGFSENFRRGFDLKYYEQLWEETFKYKSVLPITYIIHLETKHSTLDIVVIRQLKEKFYRGWEGEEHINSFGVQLNREQRKLATYTPPITISDADKNQHYLIQMWKRTDLFDEKCMTK